ncbi:hypothetical protein [Streptomyces sp. NPDC057293]|uniref:hypothetical protein n=1 Tax=unclassified Streptomyces TaxID=2593676 RepID=UPI00363D9CF1
MTRYACHDCAVTFDAPTDTATAGCPGCGELVARNEPVMPRAYPDCDRCGDTGLDPENANKPCHDCQPAPTADQTALRDRIDAAKTLGELRGVADYLERRGTDHDDPGLTAAAELLRRVADETAATETQAPVPVCICGHPEERHFEDVCQTCGCGDYLEPRDAAEVIDRWRQAALTARAEMQPRPEVAVDTLARLMCDADVHVNNGDYPGWDDLSKTPGRGQDEVRKAARYLLKRLHITERQPATGARQDGAQP